jgi:hypothetical protein
MQAFDFQIIPIDIFDQYKAVVSEEILFTAFDQLKDGKMPPFLQMGLAFILQ